ncbi:MAG TPA: DUF3147 family protein [Thermotogota bacterium]|nr:DUF3147 family protein [Thermotogota bacterium]
MGVVRILVKFLLSAAILVGVSEISKRTSVLGGLIASLPLTSLLAILWLYLDTGDPQKVASLSWSIFWFVLPSLVFFVALPLFISRLGWNVYLSIFLSSVLTMLGYGAMALVLSRFGVKL